MAPVRVGARQISHGVSSAAGRHARLPSGALGVVRSAPVGNLLLRLRPDLSAARPATFAQIVALLTLVALTFAGLLASIVQPANLIALVLVGPFLSVVLFRTAALSYALATGRRHRRRLREIPAERLPTYAVLVALYDEAHVVPGLVESLAALDYPASRLAIRFVVEECDAATQAALAAEPLPPHMGVIVVPDGAPRTKPRALNYALSRTRGSYVVVYDAEDQPEHDQLLRALAAFQRSSADTACQQASLNIANHGENWLSRQFAIEYSALFDLLLPTYRSLGLPMPLGGTSNHFRRSALEAVLAWDPHNVTEDADLGVRLARFGMKVGVIPSTTWEEAPTTFPVWLRQRTRWLKGWMTTWLVHMRNPLRLVRDIGLWPFVGLQLMMTSMIVSALVHPWFYVFAAHEVWAGRGFDFADPGGQSWVWWLAIVNLLGGYLTAMMLGAVAVLRRRRAALLPAVLLLPLYWIAISLAAYRALWQLVVAPHRWEKTPHAARPARGIPVPAPAGNIARSDRR